jgi:Glycosyltransferase family 87
MGGLARLRSYRMSPAGRMWLARGFAAIGFAFLAKTLLEYGIQGAGGGGGIDAIAYWTAASNVRQGLPLYDTAVGAFTAYPYPPVVAQVLAPFSLIPMPAFVWIWRALELGALRFAVGSWTRAGIACLLPPVIAEIDAGNVHLLMAAVCAMAMRGVAGAVAPASLIKFASVPLVPLAWVRDRRGLLVGAALAITVAAASFALAPAAWFDYAQYLTTNAFPSGWYNVAENVPLPLRLALAVAAGFAAIRWVRLAPIAIVLAYPVVWFHALSTLVAIVSPLTPLRAPQPDGAADRKLEPGRSPA